MITISFLGDISLNDTYIELRKKNINPFREVSTFMQQSDYVVGNLEAFSEGNNGENLLKNPRLKTNIQTLGYLETLNIGLVTLANNHVYDNLSDGFNRTIDFLDRNRIDHIGASLNVEECTKIFIKNIKGFKIAFLNYVHPRTNPNLPHDCPVYLNEYKRDKVVEDIYSAKKQANVVFILLHWGLDYSNYPAPWQRKDARSFLNAGADCIIGHHTHTLQGFEKIKGGYVFYGIGNFYFSHPGGDKQEAEREKKAHTTSIILNIKLDKTITFETLPIINRRCFVTIDEKNTRKQFYKLSKYLPIVSREPFWIFYNIHVKLIYKIYFFLFGNNRNPIQRLKTINRKKIIRFLEILRDLFKL
jgi:hypothetical protein